MLEASKLDFEASRLDFGMLGEATRPSFGKTPLAEISCTQARMHGSLPTLPACMAVLQHSCYQRGRRRWYPLEGFNPPPTEGVRSVLDIQPHRFQIRPDQNTKGESERPSSLCKPRLLFPSLFLSPGGWGPPESRGKKTQLPHLEASCVDF